MSMRLLVGCAAAGLAVALGASLAAADEIPASERRSSTAFMSRETQAMQQDDSANPGMLWVREGEALWNRPEGMAGRACADCHGDARASMRGLAARYPAFDEERQGPIDLEQRVNRCRVTHQGATALAPESPGSARADGLRRASIAWPGHRGRLGRTLAAACRTGRGLYRQRQGQLNLSCAGCHDDNWGKRLAGNPVPQAHPTGYPLYRLEWQGLGSLQRSCAAASSESGPSPIPTARPRWSISNSIS